MTLEVRNLIKTFAGADHPVTVLDAVSMRLDQGETLALTGESGSGKSTLLAILAGLEPFDSGEVVVGGTNIGELDDTGRARLRRRMIGVIFQQFNLIPSLDVGTNIAFQARLAQREDRDWQETLIDRLGLSEHRAKFPEQLSGGQQQRVAIGRTLAVRPDIILADEPTGNLDETTSSEVMDLMLSLASETQASLLMVTHSQALAQRLGRRLHLSRGTLS